MVASSQAGCTVLCIDDNVAGLNTRRMLLESLGCTVLTATSGPEGLELLKSNDVDVVVLDYRMPEMSGEAVAAEIRRSQPGTPIIMLSGYYAEIPESARALTDEVIQKGSEVGEFLAAIERLTGKKLPIRRAGDEGDLIDRSRKAMERAQQNIERGRRTK
jgi:CheY-like chemotaxis protein